MPRIARVVVPDYPHHITQRGNRQQQTFFYEKDYQFYIDLMSEWCSNLGVDVWAYCLMPNHSHLIVVPKSEDSLKHAIGEAHRRYTLYINSREGWKGHLWQGRFCSYILDENHLLAVTRYVEMNPVKAGIVKMPEDWAWSSASAHISRTDDKLVKVAPLLKLVTDEWKEFLSLPISERIASEIQSHEKTGRPLGSDSFVTKLETVVGRVLKPEKAGRKLKKHNK
jgi:putative transposase